MRWARWSLVGLTTAALAVALGTAAVRSTIPRAVHGVVTARQAAADGPLVSELAYFVEVDGDRMQVDRAVHDAVRVGDQVDKRRWSTSLRTPRGVVPLEASRDTRGIALLVALLTLLAAGLVRLRL